MPPQQQRRYYNMASRVSHMAGVCHFAGAPNKISVTAVATKICEPRQTLHEFRPIHRCSSHRVHSFWVCELVCLVSRFFYEQTGFSKEQCCVALPTIGIFFKRKRTLSALFASDS